MLVCTSLLIQSCIGTRYLQKNEYLLAQQTIRGNHKVPKAALTLYYQQQTNRTLLGMPIRLWLYEFGKRHFNPQSVEGQIQRTDKYYALKLAKVAGNSNKMAYLAQRKQAKLDRLKKKLKEGNWLMRLGEPPIVYNHHQQALTESNLKNYLQSKGYFDAHVSSTKKIVDRKVYIKYQIQENKPHLIQALRLISPDSRIYKLLQPYEEQSLLKKSQNYDQETLSQERERIYDTLVNQGYWDFSKQYISFQVDTTAYEDRAVVIETIIALPNNTAIHPVYNLDSIVFELNSPLLAEPNHTISYQGVFFKHIDHHFNPDAISKKIPLQKGQLYQRNKITQTQKSLNRLDIFNYVHIKTDTTDNNHLTTYIQANLAEKFQLSNEIGIEMTKLAPKPFYELSFRSRNLFKHLETLTLLTKLSIEAVGHRPNQKTFYGNRNFNVDIDLSLPQFLFPVAEKLQTWLNLHKPSTTFKLGYDFDRRNLGYAGNEPDYNRYVIKALLNYAWEATKNVSFELTPLNVNLIHGVLSKEFNAALEANKAKGDHSYRMYKSSLLSSFSLKTTLQKLPLVNEQSTYTACELLLESGGTLHNFIDFKKLFGDKLSYYKYLKFYTNFIQYIPLHANTKLAYQINIGIVYPYDQYKILPYDKYYFAGGLNSNRAWPAKSLGPGSYQPTTKLQSEERAGELCFQGNIELRQKLVSFLEGALFMDIGNIWMLSKQLQPAKNFHWDRFYREIAIGVGIGTRFDFKFFLLRLDIGMRLYDPGRPPKQRLLPKHRFEDFKINIGLGYPF
jgi:outer membrane protein insertion porin family